MEYFTLAFITTLKFSRNVHKRLFYRIMQKTILKNPEKSSQVRPQECL